MGKGSSHSFCILLHADDAAGGGDDILFLLCMDRGGVGVLTII